MAHHIQTKRATWVHAVHTVYHSSIIHSSFYLFIYSSILLSYILLWSYNGYDDYSSIYPISFPIIIIIIYPISLPIINLHHIIVLIQSINEVSIYIFLSLLLYLSFFLYEWSFYLYLSFFRLMSDVEYHNDEWWWQLIELIFLP